MNIRRIGVLLGKELQHGTRSIIFVFATVIPVVVSLVVSLAFGSLFEAAPRVGVLDEGDSQMIALFQERDYLETHVYSDPGQLRRDTERGLVQMGLIVPTGFDAAVRGGQPTDLTIYFWGEAQITDQTLLVTSLARNVVAIGERAVPVTVEAVPLGTGELASWSERLLPLLILMAIVLGGTLIPASSLVDEKQRRTLRALTITPTSLLDVMAAKVLLGVLVSLLMGVILLVMNGAFGAEPLLLIGVLALGATAAAMFGILLGALTRDMNSLFTIIKSLALVLYAPAIIELIPQLPEWLAQVFPTYYLIAPIQRITLDGATLADIAGQIGILIALIATIVAALLVVVRRQERFAAAAG